MKKLFFIIAFMALAMTASAQLSFGVKGGLNVVNMSLDSKVLEAENKAGWFIGPTVKINIPIINLGIDAAALYDQRTTEYSATTPNAGKESVKRQAINVPINLRYGFGLGEMAEVFVKAGPQFGFNVGDKNIKLESLKNIKQEYKSSEFSVNVGAGVMVLSHLEISANYNIVCGKTGEVSPISVIGDATQGIYDKSKTRNNAWQISAAYYF